VPNATLSINDGAAAPPGAALSLSSRLRAALLAPACAASMAAFNASADDSVAAGPQADAGRHSQSIVNSADFEVELAAARVARDAQQWPMALQHYANALTLEPTHRGALRERALTLSDLGSAGEAWRQYRAHAALFDANEALGFEMRYQARRLNWVQLEADPDRRSAELKSVMDSLESLLERAERQDSGAAQRIDNDRLLALNLLSRHDEVIERVEARAQAGIELPDWLRVTVADSHMARREPALAAELLEAVLEDSPGSEQATVLLAYAWLEMERFEDARSLLADWLVEHPAFGEDGAIRWSRQGVDLNSILIESFSAQLAAAYQRIESLSELAPLDAGLLDARAGIERRRGWPERALTTSQIAQTEAPLALPPRLTEIEALLDLNRDIEAKPLFESVLADYGQHRQTQGIRARWERRRGAQWSIEALRADSRLKDAGEVGPGGPGGSGEFRLNARVEGPLLRDRYRLGALYGLHWADFQGQRVERERVGVTASSRQNRAGYGVELSRTRDDFVTENTLGLWFDWRHSDLWRNSASVWHHAPFASLQARAAGIRADGLRLGASRSPDERSRTGFSLEHLRYEDSNVRTSVYVSHRQQLSAQPKREWYTRSGAGAGRGSRIDAPYFNPSRDASLDLGLTVDQLLTRDYSEAWRLRVDLDISRTWQQGFGSHWVPAIEIMPRWLPIAGHEFSLGLRYSCPVYDGNREARWALVLRMGGGE
jgi:biofilm PGA synthesis protein PgaA